MKTPPFSPNQPPDPWLIRTERWCFRSSDRDLGIIPPRLPAADPSGSAQRCGLPLLIGMACLESTFHNVTGPMAPSKVVLRSLAMGSIPAAVMLLGSLVTIFSARQPSKMLAYALQHLAAGIILCAIATELVPPLSAAKGLRSTVGIGVGFTAGVAMMIGLSLFLQHEDNDGEEDASQQGQEEEAPLINGDGALQDMDPLELALCVHDREESADTSRPSPLRASNISRLARDTTQNGNRKGPGSGSAGSTSGKSGSTTASRPRASRVGKAYRSDSAHGGMDVIGGEIVPRPRFPMMFAFCVYVDSAIDGLLVCLCGCMCGVVCCKGPSIRAYARS